MKYLVFIVLAVSLISCSQPIKLDTMRESSEFLHCDKTFGKDLNTLEHLNQFWVQTGIIDTTSESPPFYAAIIVIKNKEIVLHSAGAQKDNDTRTETYSDSIYTLTLSYKKRENEIHQNIYEGKLTIKIGKVRAVYDMTGVNCRL
jgi:hypothetical protein